MVHSTTFTEQPSFLLYVRFLLLSLDFRLLTIFFNIIHVRRKINRVFHEDKNFTDTVSVFHFSLFNLFLCACFFAFASVCFCLIIFTPDFTIEQTLRRNRLTCQGQLYLNKQALNASTANTWLSKDPNYLLLKIEIKIR